MENRCSKSLVTPICSSLDSRCWYHTHSKAPVMSNAITRASRVLCQVGDSSSSKSEVFQPLWKSCCVEKSRQFSSRKAVSSSAMTVKYFVNDWEERDWPIVVQVWSGLLYLKRSIFGPLPLGGPYPGLQALSEDLGEGAFELHGTAL